MATRPESMMIQGGPKEYKQRAILEARSAQDGIDRWLAKSDSPAASKYQFKELIGKGSYGRVYKSTEKKTGQMVAIKVLTPDDSDLNIPAEARDTNLQDALKEINILERLKQSRAVNVNQFIEAFTVHSQLWLVSEYCSGGSLSTLKRAAGGKLEERYIRAISRELALGLAAVHKAGIVHRDIKCANVMISEGGGVQIIDFGVSAVLMSNMEQDKRKTIIGTPHWMAPELQQAPDKEVPHGAEVDVWAFGITIYECAMGYPPNATVTQQARLRHLLRQQPPRLEGDKFSADLKDLVKFVLDPDPKARPTMKEVCNHPYLAGSDKEFPTSSLKNLVEIYYNWERGGGHRASLWYGGGAAQANYHQKSEQDEWVFSTTAAFDKMHGDAEDAGFDLSSSPPREGDEWDEDPSASRTLRPDALGAEGRAQQDAEAERGGAHLAGLFDQAAGPYTFGKKEASDLPLRSQSSDSLHRKEVSVSNTDDEMPNLDFNAIDRKKADKRATMAWKWTENMPKNQPTPPQMPSTQKAGPGGLGEPVAAKQKDPRQTLDLDAMLRGPARDSVRKTLDMDAMMSGGAQRNSVRKTLDLDALLSGGSISQTAAPPVPAIPQTLPAHAQKPSFQTNRPETLDLDALLGNTTSPLNASQGLGEPVSFSSPDLSEQTMRPIGHQPGQPTHGQQQQQQQQQQQHGHMRAPSNQVRPTTFNFDQLMMAEGADLDAWMANEHEYSASVHGPLTDDDGSSLASHDMSGLNMGGMHSRNESGSTGGLASSPPTGFFAQAFPDHSQLLPDTGLMPVPDYPAAIDLAALRDGVDKAVPAAEMKRLLVHFGSVLDVALSYLNEADRRAGPVHGSGGPGDDADTESIHSGVNGEDREREGTPGDEEGLEIRQTVVR